MANKKLLKEIMENPIIFSMITENDMWEYVKEKIEKDG